MSPALEKEIFLITGATNGIGLDSANFIAAASPNYHVLIGARNLSKGERVIEDLKSKNYAGTVSLIELDTNEDDSIAAAVKKIEQDFGRLDVLVNNAGICAETMNGTSISRAVLRSTFETNLFGPAVLTDALVPLLRKSKNPRIINVSSSLGSLAIISEDTNAPNIVRVPGYRMSKAALNMLTIYQYSQLKQFGFKVWTYCPGYVATDLGRDRAQREEMGVDSSETSAQGILEIVQGKRDKEAGKFVTRYGKQFQW